MQLGRSSWSFPAAPVILASAAVGGPFEAAGNLGGDFDRCFNDLWLGEASFEKAERFLLQEACSLALEKSGIKKEAVDFFLAGDLMNQIVTSSFTARELQIPYLGLFTACASAMEGLALGAFLIANGGAVNILTGTVSHNGTAEKQFRYPTEYGSQKPPTSQWTVTAAGAAILTNAGQGPRVTGATIGRVIDMGLSDPFNMGAAMAPAAVETIMTHLRDFNMGLDDYDLIVTGDLGAIGRRIAIDMLKEKGLVIAEDRFLDGGVLIYKKEQEVFAGGSGCGCVAAVTYGHLLKRLQEGLLRKILVVATGSLLSPLSYQQKESIPCVAHGVVIEA